MSLLSLITGAHTKRDEENALREIIRKEAKIGGRLFGAVPQGGRREFFCLNQDTWVWHEEWTDMQGLRHAITTRYDVRPNGILKAQDNQPYQYVGRDEAIRLCQAVKMYNQQIDAELYGIAA